MGGRVPDEHGTTPGAALISFDLGATAAFVALEIAGVVEPDSFGVAAAALSCVLFAIGIGTFLWAYALGIGRSRSETVTLPALFLLAGSAPRSVVLRLRLALTVQVVVAVTAASVRPFTNLAFGILVPMFGLGMMALWGGRYGRFPPRK
jgi:hypothetical protein